MDTGGFVGPQASKSKNIPITPNSRVLITSPTIY